MALAHTVDDRVEAANRRGDLLRKRFALAEASVECCASREAAATRRVPVRAEVAS